MAHNACCTATQHLMLCLCMNAVWQVASALVRITDLRGGLSTGNINGVSACMQEFYRACTIGGILSCGLTHTAGDPV